MKKFYKFTKANAEDRRKELFDFVTRYNKKYSSYSAVITWLETLTCYILANEDGFAFEDEETTRDYSMWGHGGLYKYNKDMHIVVNDNINLGKL